jgi:signal peptidase
VVGTIASVVVWLVLIAGMALAAAVAVVPYVTNGKALTVLSGSMVPTFLPGDMIVVKGVEDPQSLQVGQIITFMPNPDDPTLITHRIIGQGSAADGGTFYTTRGDANSADDEPIRPNQVRGVFLYSLPKLGFAAQWMGGESRVAVIGLGAGLLAYAVYELTLGGRTARRRARREAARAARTSQRASKNG